MLPARPSLHLPWFHSRIRTQAQIWVVPAGYVLSALALGWLMAQVDGRLLGGAGRTALFSTDVATSILTSVVSGMLAFTGFVFSMAFVMVQFGSSQYSPRLSGYLLRDRVFRHAIGMFTATFVYALVALTVVDRRGAGTAVDLVVIAVLAAVLGSVTFFLALIQRVTVLQVTNILHQVGAMGREVIERLYPPLTDVAVRTSLAPPSVAALPPVTQTVHYHGGPMVVIEVHVQGLARLAQHYGAVIELEYAVGDTLTDSATLLRVRGGRGVIPKQRLWQEIVIGPQRTVEQDAKYAIRLIVDIAIRALSPAINDPTTAVQALDELEDLLRRIGARRLDVGYARDAAGSLRVIYPTPLWDDFVELAVSEIRQYGAASLQVMRRLHALLDDLREAVPPERRGVVDFQWLQLVEAIPREFVDPDAQAQALQVDRQGIGLSRPAGEAS